MSGYEDIYYPSADGLRLYARDYPHATAGHVVLCLHGLTRNSQDFEHIASVLNANFRVVVPDQRGRGHSAYDPNPANYRPGTYVEDMFTLLDHLGINRAILLGTSMGGLMAMLINAARPAVVEAVILNDIGPEVDPAGLARIQARVGKSPPVSSWEEAVRQNREAQGPAFPDFSDDSWRQFTRALYREDEHGVPRLAYDPAISQPITQSDAAAVPADLWPVFEKLADQPLLLVRGALSDILSSACTAEMQRRHPDMRLVELTNRGHAPILDEPEAEGAITGFLSDLALH